MNTWTKLKDDSYGVRSTERHEAGAVVTVTKKNGTTGTATIGDEVWTGQDREGVTVWIYRVAGRSGAAKAPALTTCPHCGQRLDVAPAPPKEDSGDLPF